jgi:hypothetical protein
MPIWTETTPYKVESLGVTLHCVLPTVEQRSEASKLRSVWLKQRETAESERHYAHKGNDEGGDAENTFIAMHYRATMDEMEAELNPQMLACIRPLVCAATPEVGAPYAEADIDTLFSTSALWEEAEAMFFRMYFRRSDVAGSGAKGPGGHDGGSEADAGGADIKG